MDAWLLLVGIVAGIVSGLLGVGGGIVLTPVLHYGLGLSWAEAVALSLLVIAIQSPVGVWRHARQGAVSWRMAVPLVGAGALGVLVGDRLLPHLPVASLKLLFAGLMVLAAWRLGRTVVRPGVPDVGLLAGIGFAAGIVSRLLGVGGGIITVPMLGLVGVPVHLAVGTSLVAVFTNAAIASGANLARGLDWTGGLLLAVGAIVGTFAGVWIAHALPEQRLRRVVAASLVVAALLVGAEAVGNLL